MKNFSKYISLFIIMTIILVTTFPMTACNKENADNSVKKITLCEVTHSIFYAPQYVAIENGYFADEGLELTVTNGFGADKVMTALISGDADIGFMGSESSIYVYAEGSDDYAVNFAGLTQRAGISLSEGKPMIILNGLNLKEKLLSAAEPAVCPRCYLNIF